MESSFSVIFFLSSMLPVYALAARIFSVNKKTSSLDEPACHSQDSAFPYHEYAGRPTRRQGKNKDRRFLLLPDQWKFWAELKLFQVVYRITLREAKKFT